MREVFHIILGALFTAAVCWAGGRLLLDALRLRFHRSERELMAFVSGSACLSLYLFTLSVLHLARRGVFLWSGVACILLAIWRARRESPPAPLPRAPRAWMLLFWITFAALFFVYFINAVAPEASADGAGYHLGNVARFYRAQGFVWTHHNMYSYLPQGLEMLFLFAFAFGRHSAAAMTHLAFLTVLPWLLIAFGRRNGHPRAGIFAAIVVFSSPVVGLDGSIAYNDIGLVTVLTAIVYLLHVKDDVDSSKRLILIGILCGFAYSIKYTSATATLLAFGVAGWRLRRDRRALVTAWGSLAAGAALLAGPWILRNWIWLGNPAAPFFNRWFPNPYYHAGMEQVYANGLRHYQDLQHWWQLPWELTVHGGAGVTGFLGAAFLLTPLALLALRQPLGRYLLLAAVVLGLPALLNTGTRFLIPAAPFVALALGLALENSWGALPLLAAFQAVLAWPTVMPIYCHPYAWRIGSIPIDAALRKIPPDDFIASRSGDYPLLKKIEQVVPPGGRIYSFAGRPEAYCSREILVSYESAEANLINDILLAPIDGFKPVLHRTFRFPEQSLRAIRVVETASAAPYWGMAEVRLQRAGAEIPRDPRWMLEARPNGWEAGLAFDNSPVTRWQSWEAMRPGQFVEVRFPAAAIVDALVLECNSVRESHPRVEGQGSDGAWRILSSTPEDIDADTPRGMRRAAALELKARGVGWLLVNSDDFAWEDMSRFLPYWGMTDMGEAGGTHFLRID